jgi:hypothetical protein
MMFRSLILIISLCFYTYAHAQILLPDIGIPQLDVGSLLIPLAELPVDSFGIDNDLLYNNNWSSTQIRYPQSLLPSKEDTVTILLVGFNDHSFVPPVKGKVISKYGRRSGRVHTGTDIKLNSGDTVRCAFDGRVRIAKRFSGYGNVVVVRHKNGLETIYGHLKTISVQVNDTLLAGDLVGLGGRTGRATCDHLHFETRLLGEPFDSNKYIDFESFALISDKIYYKNRQIETDPVNFKSKTTRSRPGLPAGADGITEHVISKGDNLWAIAKKYSTTVNKLCAANNIKSDKVLKVGSVLLVN